MEPNIASHVSTVAGARYNDPVADSIEQLSFEMTADAMKELERALAGLRTCAGTVLGTASVAGAFLARTADGALDVYAILALLAFILCFGCATWVLLPQDFVLAAGGNELLAVSDGLGVRDVSDAYRSVGRWLEPALQANRRTVSRLSGWLTASCVLLAIEIALWTLSLVG